jgi:AraC-type DNA-binding domain-containing proteins
MQAHALNAVLEMIEENLAAPLNADWLAREAGYSIWHFYRLFSAKMQMSLGEYILDRRLKSVLHAISQGEKAVEAALLYGFDTYAGFYKAFKRAYGTSPSKYRRLYGAALEKPKEIEEVKEKMTHAQIKALLKAHYFLNGENKVFDVLIMHGAKIADNVWNVDNRYILKKAGSLRGFQKNIHIANALKTQGLRAALPVKTDDGEDFFKEGDDFYMLTEKISGGPLKPTEFYLHGKDCGRALAKLHKALLALDKVIPCDKRDILQEVRGWAMPQSIMQAKQWEMKLPQGFFEEVEAGIGILGELPVQIIHRDPNPDNIIFENGQFSGFIDFDLSQRSIRLFDVCYCATGALSATVWVDELREKWLLLLKEILVAYHQENPLTKKEQQAVFYVICAIEMICVAYFGSIDNTDMKKLAKINRQMFEFIADKREEIEKIFV